MKILKESIFTLQPPQTEAEGLPYWILWLLICIILLLVIFIFLRDRDLRRRLDNFFFGAKKRFIKLRLQVKLRKEKRLRQEILKELGENAWKEKAGLNEDNGVWKKLNLLEDRKKVLQKELREVEAKIAELNLSSQKTKEKFEEGRSRIEKEKFVLSGKISELNSRKSEIIKDIADKNQKSGNIASEINLLREQLIELEKNKKANKDIKQLSKVNQEERIKELQGKKQAIESEIKENLEEKEKLEKESSKFNGEMKELENNYFELKENESNQIQRINNELKEWEKEKNKLLKSIDENKKQKHPLFVELGKTLEKTREEYDSFVVFYSQLDRVNKSIQEIEIKLKEL